MWKSLTATVLGLIASGRVDPAKIRPDWLHPEFRDLFHPERDVFGAYGVGTTSELLVAASQVPEGAENLYVMRLIEEAERNRLAARLENLAGRLRAGFLTSHALKELATIAAEGDISEIEFVPLDQIQESEPIVPCGFDPLDRTLGGIPRSSLTVIGGDPGSGKTTLMLQIARGFAECHGPFGIFSLEMSRAQLYSRWLRMADLEPELHGIARAVHVVDCVSDPRKIAWAITKFASAYSAFAIDFAQLMLQDVSEGKMAEVFVLFARLAREVDRPIFLLSQLNRAASTYGRIPTIHDLRYSGMAEAVAALVLLIWNPSRILSGNVPFDKSQIPFVGLTPSRGRGYIFVGKSRYGYGNDQTGPFALSVRWERGLWRADDFTVHRYIGEGG